MRAFLTGAIIGLTGYTLGIIAARYFARHSDPVGNEQAGVERYRRIAGLNLTPEERLRQAKDAHTNPET